MQLDELINVTANGLQIANFGQIRDSLIEWYKSKFGSDIDLGTGTADGVFVYDLAIILNNVFDAISNFENQMHLSSATGSNLDSLVRLSNIFRKQATNSTASLQVTNTSDEQITETNLTFLTDDGLEWIANEASITFAANETKIVEVHCTTPGRILAPAGSINKTIQISTLIVTQPNDAIPGRNTETDEELKLRFSQTQGASSKTVLEGLIASLLTISGIKDVKIYNNNSGSAQIMKDTTNVAAHDVYIIVRKDESVTIDEKVIGSLIHSSMTPGIKTAEMESGIISGTGKTYVYLDNIYGNTISEVIDTIYWKEAVPVSPEIKIILSKRENYISDTERLVSNAVSNYMNSLPIDTDIYNTNGIVNVARNAIPERKGKPVAYIYDVTIDGGYSYIVPNTYYKYNSITVVASEDRTMIINQRTYSYLSSMTWADWVVSAYNTIGATISSGKVVIDGQQLVPFGSVTPVNSTDLISAHDRYVYSTAQLGYFYVGAMNYTFEIGQDFDTWMDSSYNPFEIGGGRIFEENGKLATYTNDPVYAKVYLIDDDFNYITKTALIENGKTYGTSI